MLWKRRAKLDKILYLNTCNFIKYSHREQDYRFTSNQTECTDTLTSTILFGKPTRIFSLVNGCARWVCRSIIQRSSLEIPRTFAINSPKHHVRPAGGGKIPNLSERLASHQHSGSPYWRLLAIENPRYHSAVMFEAFFKGSNWPPPDGATR